MNKVLSILLTLSASFTLLGAEMPVERIYVSTDREVYIAGDVVWCSLFCVDPQGRLSSQSAVSYLELISTEGTVAEAKVGLLAGRGAGSFRIPVTVPTGVYRLVSYTAVNTNEEGTPWIAGSRILTIFNTLSAARVKDGVEILDEGSYSRLQRTSSPTCGSVEFSSSARVRKGSDVGVFIRNNGPVAEMSFSVYHEDDIIPAAQDNSVGGFLASLSSSANPDFIGDRPLEYDGEIITAHVKGRMTGNSLTTLSSAGAPSNLYVGLTDNGRVSFMTNNIYGERDIVCEVSGLDGEGGAIEIDNPFIYPSSGPMPKLQLSKVSQSDLVARKVALRGERTLRLDTLSTLTRHREDLFLESAPLKRFHLDNYTRFPSVKEVLVEIIPMLSLHREKGKNIIRITVIDGADVYKTRVGNLLVMMDGVVITDIDKLLEFDAMLIEDVDVYQQAVTCGPVSFSGVANFITKRNYVTALSFPSNVRVLDFKGVSYPVAYYGTPPEGDGEDLRQVLYWDPALRVGAGAQERITLRAPGYQGRFRAVADGIAGDGSPIHHEWTFEVE